MSACCTLVDLDSGRRTTFEHMTPAWAAAGEWLRFHGLDPNRIPCPSTIYRNGANRRILFTEFVFDADDQLVLTEDGMDALTVDRIEQGEGLLPFPAEVWQ